MLLVSTYPGTLLKINGEETIKNKKAIKTVQKKLNEKGYSCKIDGYFGNETKEQVEKFQEHQKVLEPDGIVGPLTWEKLFDEIPPEEPSQETMKVLRTLSARKDIYHKPTFQDNEGLGIWTSDKSERSEQVYPAFVLGPRRQVDSLVRQMYALLPNPNTAFIITDRLVQYPHEYLPYISGAERVVLIGSFVGIGDEKQDLKGKYERHDRELWQLEQSIRLVQAMKRPIQSVVFAMGDSPRPDAEAIRSKIQDKLYTLLEKYNLSDDLKKPITWGADETTLVGFAQTLDLGKPHKKVLVRISNSESKTHYEGDKPAQETVIDKLKAVGLTKVNQGWDFDSSFATTNTDWDFEIAILTRRKDGNNEDYEPNDQDQKKLDEDFLNRYRNYSPEQHSKLVIIDGRLYNGAWDSLSALQSCDLLAFGSWGTFGNVVGATLAIAKILWFAKNPLAQKQLYLEAVAHDVFANGYAEAQKGELKEQVDKVTDFQFDHFNGYETAQDTAQVFAILNKLVNQRMQEHFAGTNCLEGKKLRFTPQLWRTFESEVHFTPPLEPKIAQAGIFRQDLDPKVFQPNPK
jgi:hypothetical protein